MGFFAAPADKDVVKRPRSLMVENAAGSALLRLVGDTCLDLKFDKAISSVVLKGPCTPNRSFYMPIMSLLLLWQAQMHDLAPLA